MSAEEMIVGVAGWLGPILSTCITVYVAAMVRSGEAKRDEARAETDAKRRAEAQWRESVDAKLDALGDATQTTMRANLIHFCEKYLERGWVTPEERASIWDMHHKYSALNANGFIDTYIRRVMELPDREI
jgi:hypothetical protein